MPVNKSFFNDLIQSLKEAKIVSQGKVKPSRRFAISPLDVKAVQDMLAIRSAQALAREETKLRRTNY